MDFPLNAAASKILARMHKCEISRDEAAAEIAKLVSGRCRPRYSDQVCLTHGQTLSDCERDHKT